MLDRLYALGSISFKEEQTSSYVSRAASWFYLPCRAVFGRDAVVLGSSDYHVEFRKPALEIFERRWVQTVLRILLLIPTLIGRGLQTLADNNDPDFHQSFWRAREAVACERLASVKFSLDTVIFDNKEKHNLAEKVLSDFFLEGANRNLNYELKRDRARLACRYYDASQTKAPVVEESLFRIRIKNPQYLESINLLVADLVKDQKYGLDNFLRLFSHSALSPLPMFFHAIMQNEFDDITNIKNTMISVAVAGLAITQQDLLGAKLETCFYHGNDKLLTDVTIIETLFALNFRGVKNKDELFRRMLTPASDYSPHLTPDQRKRLIAVMKDEQLVDYFKEGYQKNISFFRDFEMLETAKQTLLLERLPLVQAIALSRNTSQQILAQRIQNETKGEDFSNEKLETCLRELRIEGSQQYKFPWIFLPECQELRKKIYPYLQNYENRSLIYAFCRSMPDRDSNADLLQELLNAIPPDSLCEVFKNLDLSDMEEAFSVLFTDQTGRDKVGKERFAEICYVFQHRTRYVESPVVMWPKTLLALPQDWFEIAFKKLKEAYRNTISEYDKNLNINEVIDYFSFKNLIELRTFKKANSNDTKYDKLLLDFVRTKIKNVGVDENYRNIIHYYSEIPLDYFNLFFHYLTLSQGLFDRIMNSLDPEDRKRILDARSLMDPKDVKKIDAFLQPAPAGKT